MVKVLLTGGDGFIGKFLTQKLESQSIPYYSFTRKKGDITDFNAWKNLPKAEYVVHLAGENFVPESWKRSSDFLQANVVGTNNALEYCVTNQAKLIYISAYIYGIPERLPISESSPASPNNPYAISKYLAEELCKYRARIYRQNICILRLFNVYGYGQRQEFLIPRLIEQAFSRNEIHVLDLKPRRDYIYIEDVIDAICKCMNSSIGFSTYNIGLGKSYSVKEVIDLIAKILKKDIQIISKEEVRQQEIPETIADISLAKLELNWEPKFSLSQGLQNIIEREMSDRKFKS